MTSTVLFVWAFLWVSLWAFLFLRRKRVAALDRKKPEVKAAQVEPSPPLDPLVGALLESLNNEPSRWDVHTSMAFRDDFIALASDGKGVSIYENYQASRNTDPVKIPGEHNGKAVEQALRLSIERRRNPATPTYEDLRRKLGV